MRLPGLKLFALLFMVAAIAGCAGTVAPTLEMVYVKGGCFPMGDVFGTGKGDEKPVHEVCVSDFYIGKYEVTQSQWERVMGDNPASGKACGPECPVENVSWNRVQKFIQKLNRASRLNYRLPTEAEWEYAARSGGKKEQWSGTNEREELRTYAWFDENFDKNTSIMTHRVGLKKPNGLRIHDMSGNVLEWCQDWYDEKYYASSPKDDPQGPSDKTKKVLRGGVFNSDADDIRVSRRFSDDPEVWDGNNGFRLVRPVSPPPVTKTAAQ